MLAGHRVRIASVNVRRTGLLLVVMLVRFTCLARSGKRNSRLKTPILQSPSSDTILTGDLAMTVVKIGKSLTFGSFTAFLAVTPSGQTKRNALFESRSSLSPAPVYLSLQILDELLTNPPNKAAADAPSNIGIPCGAARYAQGEDHAVPGVHCVYRGYPSLCGWEVEICTAQQNAYQSNPADCSLLQVCHQLS